MTTPRRVTRSASRDLTPGPSVSDVASTPKPTARTTRASSKRADAIQKDSTAFGFKGQTTDSATLATENSEDMVLELIQSGVHSAKYRPSAVAQSTTTSRASLSGIVEEGEEAEGREDEGTLETSGIRDRGAVTGHGTPSGEGTSKSFGTEGPFGGHVAVGVTPHQQLVGASFNPIVQDVHKVSSNAGNAKNTEQHDPRTGTVHALPESGPQTDGILPDFASQRYPLHQTNASRSRFLKLFSVLFLVGLLCLGLRAYPLPKYNWPKYEGLSRNFRDQTVPYTNVLPAGVSQREWDYVKNEVSSLRLKVNSILTDLNKPKTDRVNYFSLGLGAIVDPHLTSPTRKRTVSARLWPWGTGTFELNTPSPATALAPWADIGDCWCAPATGDGRAQITVHLPKTIVPTDLVIEHIGRDATLDIGAAPLDIELWVQIKNPENRKRVHDAAMSISDLNGENPLAARTMYDYQATKALDKSWVRIGRFKYDIYAHDNVQTFKVPIDLDDFQVAVNKVSVRVRRNWGQSEYTCLYRLKLHGLLALSSHL